jgi:transcriptional regulator with XRE-family HTH domain
VDLEHQIGRALRMMREQPRSADGTLRPPISLAELSQALGVNQRTLRAWEALGDPRLKRASKRIPSPSSIEAWADACGYVVSLSAETPTDDALRELSRLYRAASPDAQRVALLAVEACDVAEPALVRELEERLQAWRARGGRAGRPG